MVNLDHTVSQDVGRTKSVEYMLKEVKIRTSLLECIRIRQLHFNR